MFSPPNVDTALQPQWMAVATSDEVKSAPVQRHILGEAIVLWRNQDGVHAFRDLCIHRGTALSLGRVEDSTLVCPYHGWRFDGTGQCTLIPAQPDLPIPTRAKALRYATCEQHGLIWVALAEPEVPPPSYLEAESADFKTIICGPYTVNAAAPRVIENFLDVSHLMWVHEGYLGDSAHAAIPEYRVHDQDGGLITDPIDIFQPDPDGRGKDVINRYTYSVLRPLTAYFRKTDNISSDTFAMLLHATPTAERQTTAYALLSRNYAFETPDDIFREFQDRIFSQDVTIMLSQRPEELPLDLSAELHIKSDRLAIAYRKWLRSKGVMTGVM